MVRISKTYTPKEKEKYMCAKHLAYFKMKLLEWKKDLKRLMARPVATLCIAAQEKHEKDEKVYADD